MFKQLLQKSIPILHQLSPRLSFHTTNINQLKKICVNEDAKKKLVQIDGEYIPEDSNQKALKFGNDTKHSVKPCAFCELEKNNIYVQHTDVLILKQFLKQDGEILSRKVTGLCKKQQRKLVIIAKHAKNAGLTSNLTKSALNSDRSLVQQKIKAPMHFHTYFNEYEQMKKTHKFL